MNRLQGIIDKVETNGRFSLVSVRVNRFMLKSIIIETPETVPFLRQGNRVKVMFKETEVAISREEAPRISLQNRLPCRLRQLEKGHLLARLVLDFEGEELGSVITTNAVRELELKENDPVTALIKTNEIILAP